MLTNEEISNIMKNTELQHIEPSSVRLDQNRNFLALFIYQNQIFERTGLQIMQFSNQPLFPQKYVQFPGLFGTITDFDQQAFWWFFTLVLESQFLYKNELNLRNFFQHCYYTKDFKHEVNNVFENLKNLGVRVGSKIGMLQTSNSSQTCFLDLLHGTMVPVGQFERQIALQEWKLQDMLNQTDLSVKNKQFLDSFYVPFFAVMRAQIKNDLLDLKKIENTVSLNNVEMAGFTDSVQKVRFDFEQHRIFYSKKLVELEALQQKLGFQKWGVDGVIMQDGLVGENLYRGKQEEILDQEKEDLQKQDKKGHNEIE
ncbi:hypothetical protein SS50377_21794 [Spironucleus salmonicida]|uniref:Uncharacterized protein n=1 Tax=Spironucleus salmonicida TaxID=348837 RepID=V6LLM3_9EUKA|nr:hypothetical protein SS50377_21794 [Spironucleus salmonicida]|eukprot:EST45457.1 Hypothetical protein SS50377_14611 [Spironucleus salmonicida]